LKPSTNDSASALSCVADRAEHAVVSERLV
jgi:hypothetical protein